MTTTTTTTTPSPPRRGALDRGTASALATTEYARFADALEALGPDDWSAPTACPGWDVRAVAGHCLGMARFAASPLELARQMVAAQRRQRSAGGEVVDSLTALQVERTAGLTTAELVREYRAVGPRAARGRRRLPGPVRAVRSTQVVGGVAETWTNGFLLDVILTRDAWMHRSDVAAATGRPMVLTADHDGVLVADVVAEWADRHGRPFSLVLTGPAGGRWSHGAGGETHELDAVEFCRLVSGRGAGEGLLVVQVPF